MKIRDIHENAPITRRAVGVVVSHPLSMREAPGSIPGLSTLLHVLLELGEKV